MKKQLLTLILLFLLLTNGFSQKVIPLYEGTIPNSKPSPDEETSETRDGILIVSKISRPTLSIYLPSPEKATGTAVIICPGGGYWINAIGHEGYDVAQEFVKLGIAAFVLKYRIPNDKTMINREIGPLQDAQRAIQVVRSRAKEWNVNPERIGIMGFSAGGHLASTAGTHYKTAVIDNPGNISLRPDFMILIYPVISLDPVISHGGSGEQLIGKNPPTEKIKYYSNELQITADTPPAFLVHASDDEVVKSANSIVFYEHLISNKVGAEMHIYQKGGHGFGLNNKTTKDRWMERCVAWMDSIGWMKR